jgi:hypothetical protein
MAYPNVISEGENPVLEEARDEDPLAMVHGDIAFRNIMIGNREATIPERTWFFHFNLFINSQLSPPLSPLSLLLHLLPPMI